MELRRPQLNGWRFTIIVVAVLGLGALAACNSDDSGGTTTTTSPQAAYCDAGAQLKTDVTALGDLDLIAEGTNGLTAAIDAVKSDIDELRETATSATSDQIDALSTSVDELATAASSAGSEPDASSLSALTAAIGDVGTSATAVYDTLTDCP